MSVAYDRILDRLREAGRPVRMEGPNRARSTCPAHDGDNPTALSVRDGVTRVSITCHTQACDSKAVMEALGLTLADAYHQRRGNYLATYAYDDGRRVHRTGGKDFPQSGNLAAPSLFHRSKVVDAVASGRTVYLTEGEEDALALESLGVCATTAPMGCKGFHKVDCKPLAGADVVAVVDQDQHGEGDGWAAQVADKLAAVGARVRFVRARVGKDADDHVTAGHGVEDFEPYAPPTVPQDAPGEPLEPAGGPVRSSWAPVDLGPILDGLLSGTLKRLAPTVGRVRSAGCLIYPGRVNSLFGESGCGKTWSALEMVRQELADGRGVVFIDLEDDAAGITARLLDLGTDPEAIRERFAYVSPEHKLTRDAQQDVSDALERLRPSLVVIDSTGESIALEGLKPNDDDQVAVWFRMIPAAIAKTGPAVLVLDHVVKADAESLWPSGSQRKRAAVNGAAYLQAMVKPFSKDTPGLAKLVCAKDRHGTYRFRQKVAELHVRPAAAGVDLDLCQPQGTGGDAPRPWRPTAIMEKLSRLLEDAGEPLSFRRLDSGVSGKAEHKRQALAALEDGDFIAVRNGPGNSHLHESRKPYRQADDPGSDAYQPRDTLDPETASLECVSVSVSLDGDTGHTHSTVSGTHPGHTRDTPSNSGRNCPECGDPLPPGRVRHPECFRAMEAAR